MTLEISRCKHMYIKREEKPQVNNLSVYLKVLKNNKGKLNPMPALGWMNKDQSGDK